VLPSRALKNGLGKSGSEIVELFSTISFSKNEKSRNLFNYYEASMD
jgi:hypothetical protein